MPRNLSEDHIKFIIERSGMIGVSISPEMLSLDKKAGLYDVFVHIDWFVQKFGHECIGIGSDFGGFDIPNTEIDSYIKLDPLKAEFLESGYPSSAVSDIMGKNWCRFYDKAV
jgi:membrane dipeptidase